MHSVAGRIRITIVGAANLVTEVANLTLVKLMAGPTTTRTRMATTTNNGRLLLQVRDTAPMDDHSPLTTTKTWEYSYQTL